MTINTKLVKAIFRANLTGDNSEVVKMVGENSCMYNGVSFSYNFFNEVSKANARSMLRNWLTTGKMPVATRTAHDWDNDIHEVYETNYVDFYACVRPSVDSSLLCFYPDFVSEAESLGIKVVETENGFNLVEEDDKYELMAEQFGYVA